MYPKAFFANSDIKVRGGSCFVIMPFASGFDEVYETIREAMEDPSLSFECVRADDLQGGGHIIEDILRRIGEAEIVIADLTGRNPNVFYELGIVQMTKDVDKVLLLSQDADAIPFDVRVFRSITYQQSIRGARELKAKLIEGVKSVTANDFRFKYPSNGTYTFPQKLMGPDHRAYDFSLSGGFVAYDGAKFMIQMTRHIVGETPEIVWQDGWGMSVGERRALPHINWDLTLERVTGNVASCRLERRVAVQANTSEKDSNDDDLIQLRPYFVGNIDWKDVGDHTISLALTKSGLSVAGTLQFLNGKHSGKKYRLIGRYFDTALTFTYSPLDKVSTSQGSGTFIRCNDGDTLRGYFAYISQMNGQVETVPCDLRAETPPA